MTVPPNDEIIQALLNERQTLEKRLKAIEDALMGFGYTSHSEDPNNGYGAIFEDCKTIKEKIFWVLKHADKALCSEDVRKIIIQKENDLYKGNSANNPNLTENRYPAIILVTLSSLYKKKEIKAHKIGKKNFYHL